MDDRLRSRATEGTDGERSARSRRFPVGVRGLLLAFAFALAGVVLGGFVPLLGPVGRLVGLLLAAFALGLRGRRRYLEVGVAGAAVGGVATVLGALGPFLLPVVADYGVAVGGVGAGTGLLVSLLGHYLGRDLRAGLSRDL
ncbi:MAG: hypothetical protein ABEH47_04035 [Haloferacaceae archaeon]